MPAKEKLTERKRTDLMLSLTALEIIPLLAKKLGIGKVHVIELAVREMAKKEGVR